MPGSELGPQMGKAPFCCRSTALASSQLHAAGFMSIWRNRLVEAHVFKPRKWQTGFKPGLQLGEPHLPGYHPCPSLNLPTCPQESPPNPSVPLAVQEVCSPQGRRWLSTGLLDVFGQEPLVRREESWVKMPAAQGVRLEQGWGKH